MTNIIKFIPNSITISRFLISIIFSYCILECFLYGETKFISLTVLYLLICTSDILDGKIARKTGFISKTGAQLDVFADLFFLVTSYISLILVGVLPMWFLVFIILKFTEFSITSNFATRNNKSLKHPFVFDKIGRLVSASFFFVPFIACFDKILFPYSQGHILNIILYIIMSAGIYSSILRIKSCLIMTKIKGGYLL